MDNQEIPTHLQKIVSKINWVVSCEAWELGQNYSVFHQFRQAKFGNGGSILSSSQFLLLP